MCNWSAFLFLCATIENSVVQCENSPCPSIDFHSIQNPILYGCLYPSFENLISISLLYPIAFKSVCSAQKHVLIKITSAWEGIQAAHILQFQHGMSCSLPLMFSPVQAIAGAVAGAFPTTPFVGCIYVYWVKMSSCPTTFGGKKKEGMNGG